MRKGISLDLDGINVVSFETSPEVQARGVLLATRHTGDPCCVNTECVTRIECSSARCP